MIGRRQNDPLEVCEQPNLVTNPVREAELAAEAFRKILYVLDSFALARQIVSGPTINESMRRLKSWHQVPGRGSAPFRMHLEVMVLVQHLAGVNAKANGVGAVRSDEHKAAGEREAVGRWQVKNGRARHDHERRHVEGLMAVLQEVTGRAVHGTSTKGYAYDPQPSDQLSQTVVDLIRHADPAVTQTRIVNIIRDARRRYRGTAMRFCDLFPFYRTTATHH